jgi:hypothetical protein
MSREIKITPVLNGFVVKIGCQTVVFNSLQSMAGEVLRYYGNPSSIEAEYRKNAVNKLDELAIPCPPPEHRNMINHPVCQEEKQCT